MILIVSALCVNPSFWDLIGLEGGFVGTGDWDLDLGLTIFAEFQGSWDYTKFLYHRRAFCKLFNPSFSVFVKN